MTTYSGPKDIKIFHNSWVDEIPVKQWPCKTCWEREIYLSVEKCFSVSLPGHFEFASSFSWWISRSVCLYVEYRNENLWLINMLKIYRHWLFWFNLGSKAKRRLEPASPIVEYMTSTMVWMLMSPQNSFFFF